MTIDIFRLNTDTSIVPNILDDLRNRELSQKYIYLWNWADLYHEYLETFWWDDSLDIANAGDFKEQLLSSGTFTWKEKVSFVSFACGNSSKEHALLKEIKPIVQDIKYVGVDFSEEMLNSSKETLEDSWIDTTLIRSDISNIDLKQHLNNLTEWSDIRVFCLFGNTLWNVKITNMVDMIAFFMNSWDKLLLDVAHMDWKALSMLKVFDNYRELIWTNKTWRKFVVSWLWYIGFPLEKGKIVVETHEDTTNWNYEIVFSLQMNENVDFRKNDQLIVFSKWEKINLLHVNYYIADNFLKFMGKHHFNVLSQKLKSVNGQFLFEKE